MPRKEPKPATNPPRPGRPDGSFEFVELSSEDPHATERFLSSVFDWRFRSRTLPQGEYLEFEAPGGGRGGVRPTRPREAPASLSYVRVDDLSNALDRVTRAGGTIVLDPVDLPGMGSFFWFQVPGGPVVACWQDATPESKKE